MSNLLFENSHSLASLQDSGSSIVDMVDNLSSYVATLRKSLDKNQRSIDDEVISNLKFQIVNIGDSVLSLQAEVNASVGKKIPIMKRIQPTNISPAKSPVMMRLDEGTVATLGPGMAQE